MRIILDTNVLVSALIQRSYPYRIVDTVLANPDITLCLSPALLEEYVAVLSREKFSRYPEFHARAGAMVEELSRYALLFQPTVRLSVLDDGPDNRILELAESCSADFIVTGNTNDFTLLQYKSTRIISPRAFAELLFS